MDYNCFFKVEKLEIGRDIIFFIIAILMILAFGWYGKITFNMSVSFISLYVMYNLVTNKFIL